MIILVSAAALRTSGARTIYRQFIEHLKTRVDGNIYYIMVDKDMEMPTIDGVKYLVVDISSKIKRLLFEAIGFHALMKDNNVQPEVIISLQNIGIRSYRNIPQIIYYHQSLPFFDYNWNVLNKKELIMFLYKHLYPFFVKRSIGEKTKMIAQLPSIKKGIVSKYGVKESNVYVLFPDLENIIISDVKSYPYGEGDFHLLFPATDAPYKGHRFLVSVMSKLHLVDEAIAKKIKIHFTLSEKTSVTLVQLMQAYGVRDNFVFHGVVAHETLLSMYKSANGLLFPSVIETLGLPLIEAARFGLPIIACDLEYAHEVLNGYEGATFVDARSESQWAKAVAKEFQRNVRFTPLQNPQKSSWESFFDLVENAKV